MRSILPGVCAVLTAAQLGAATLSRLSLDDMINQSTAIVHVQITGSYAAFRGSTIYTYYQAQVLDSWKGSGPGLVNVALPGGTANGYRQSFDGTPQLITNKEYVLFLWTSPSGLTQVIGLTQGLFEVSRNSQGGLIAVRGTSTNTMLDPVTGRAVKDQSLQVAFGDLTTQIASTLAQAKTN